MSRQTKELKQVSKAEFTALSDLDGKFTTETIKLSAILRIADSMEAMAKHHTDLQRSHDYLKKRNKDLIIENNFLKRSQASYKGKMNNAKSKKA